MRQVYDKSMTRSKIEFCEIKKKKKKKIFSLIVVDETNLLKLVPFQTLAANRSRQMVSSVEASVRYNFAAKE